MQNVCNNEDSELSCAMMYSAAYERIHAMDLGVVKCGEHPPPHHHKKAARRLLKSDPPVQLNTLMRECIPSFIKSDPYGIRRTASLPTVSPPAEGHLQQQRRLQRTAYINELSQRLGGHPRTTSSHQPTVSSTGRQRGQSIDASERDTVKAVMYQWVEERAGGLCPAPPARAQTAFCGVTKGTFHPSEEPSVAASLGVRWDSIRSLNRNMPFSEATTAAVDLARGTTEFIAHQQPTSSSQTIGSETPLHSLRQDDDRNTSLAAELTENNWQRLQQRFEYDRSQKQTELVAFLRWRSTCRRAVKSSLSNRIPGDGSSASVRSDRVLEILKKRSLQSAGPQFGTTQSLASVWTTAAYELALDEKKRQLCADIERFSLDFQTTRPAKHAMENLRKEVLRLIQTSKKHRASKMVQLLTKDDLLRYVSVKYNSTGSHSHTTGVTPNDVIEALPSTAERAFLRFALNILPY